MVPIFFPYGRLYENFTKIQEASGTAVDPISAAIILADKTDVRRNRVRNTVPETFDKHDTVNYAALTNKLHIDSHKKVITLEIELDENICSMIDY